MNEYDINKKYESFKIPGKIPDWKQEQDGGTVQLSSKTDSQPKSSRPDEMFYEIEYDNSPFPGVGKFVLKPLPQRIAEPEPKPELKNISEQERKPEIISDHERKPKSIPERIPNPEKDEIRELFGQMRDIARMHRSTYDFSRFFDSRVQNDNATIFYQQGMFMKDFTDDYAGSRQYSQYFPSYQMMGYEQLRTYFTWRSQVRKDNVTDTSLSYAFLYIYELLDNIGVANPLDGLDKLTSFWKVFRDYNKSVDIYVLRWLKDYHVYYELPHAFKEFVEKNSLTGFYTKLAAPDDEDFGLFCAISKYNIKKSKFFNDETSKIVTECFSFVIDRIRRDFEAAGMNFDSALFRPTQKIVTWKPFRDALFYNWLKQPDRQVVLSANEIYVCKKNEWTFSTIITTEKGKRFIGYVMKKMESVLRKIMNYKIKLNANTNMVNDDTIRVLTKAGLFIEEIVPAAVIEYYREVTKTVVTVDHASLARIRQEALVTQELLIVEEQALRKGTASVSEQAPTSTTASVPAPTPAPVLAPAATSTLTPAPATTSTLTPAPAPTPAPTPASAPTPALAPETTSTLTPAPAPTPAPAQNVFADAAEEEPASPPSVWDNLKDALSEEEVTALAVVLQAGDLKAFAIEHEIMVEVLVDGINEKAMDNIGDNLMDENFVLYDEYIQQVKEFMS
ncbi:MAG: TerB N-terminal domain-containing protein [Oscillospiraceae bacterium]|nr:TerB N-terminal domain-containing protein [Oscillospiraceae bacterium]